MPENKYNIKSEDPGATRKTLLAGKDQVASGNPRSNDKSINNTQKLLYDFIKSKGLNTYADYIGRDPSEFSKEAREYLAANGVKKQDIIKFQEYLKDYTGAEGFKTEGGKIKNFVDGDFGDFSFDAFMKLKARGESENEYFLQNPQLTNQEQLEVITKKSNPYVFDADHKFMVVGDRITLPKNDVNAPPGTFPTENVEMATMDGTGSRMKRKSVQFVDPSTIPTSGLTKGPGTPKSDSITTQYPEGTLVVPFEKMPYAQEIYKKYINKDIPTSRPAGDGTVIKVSDKEFIFTPEDLEYIKNRGGDITPILPPTPVVQPPTEDIPEGADGLLVQENEFDFSNIVDNGESEFDFTDIVEPSKKKVSKEPLSPFIAAPAGQKNVAYQPDGLESEIPSTSNKPFEFKFDEPTGLQTPQTVGTGTGGQAITNTAPETQREFGAMDGFLNAVDRGMKEGEVADILALGREPSKDELRQIAKLKREQGQLPSSKPYEDFSKAETVGEQVKLLASNPVEILSQLTAESMAAMLRHGYSRVLAGTGEGAIAGSIIPVAGTVAGAGLGMLAGMTMAGYNLETANSILQSLQEAGVDVADEESLVKAFEDKETMDKARSFAAKRAVPIALFDMVSAGLGGKILGKPAKSIIGKIAKGAAEVGVQTGLAGAGETTAQLSSDGEIKPTEVFAEMLGEVGGGAPEIVIGTIIEKSKKGDSIKKDIATSYIKKEVFDDMLDISEGVGEITPEQADAIKVEYDLVQKAKEKTPADFKANPEVVEGIANKEILQGQLASIEQEQSLADEAFKPLFDEKKKAVQDQIDLIDENINNQIKPKQDATSERKVEQNDQQERVGADEKREKSEAISSNSAIESRQVQEEKEITSLEGGLSDKDLTKYSTAELDVLIKQLEDGMVDILAKGDTKRAEKLREVIGTVIDVRNRDNPEWSEEFPESKRFSKEKEVTSYPKRAQDFAKEEGFVPSSEQEMQQYVSEKSEDPIEIIETFKLSSPESKKSYKETILEENAIKVDKESYERFGDPKKVGAEMARQFFSKPKGAETKIDVIAENLSSQYGVEITPNDIVEYIEDAKYERKLSDTQVKLRDRFTKITGLPFSEKRIKKVYDEQAKKEQIDLDKYLNKEANDYETARKEYLERIRSGEIPISEYEPVGDVTSDTGLQGREGEKGRKEKLKSDRAYQSSKQLLSDVPKKVKDELDVAFKDISEIKFSEEKGDWIDQNNNVIPQLSPESERVLDAINVVSEGENLLSIIKNIVKGETSLGKQLAGDKEVQEVREQVAKGLKDKLKKINDALSEKKTPDTKTDTDNIIQAKILPVKEIIQAGFKPINKVQEKIFGEQVDKVKEWVAKKVKEGNQSSNNIKRWGSQFITSWSNGIPRTLKDLQEKRLLKGGISLANDKFEQALKKFHELVGNNVESLERIHQVLDPDFYSENESLFGKKVTMDDLTPNEKALAQTLRDINDYIHDWNFSMGLIDIKTYLANKDKYIARLYNAFEIPEDAQAFLENNEMPIGNKRVKLITDIFKAREEITEWKKNNIVRDPVYLTMKRMRETEVNASILSYIDHIAKQRGMISKEPKKGFTQLNGKAYGKLNEMYVPNYIAEDFQGFFFGNQIVDLLYDVSKVYDRNQIKQFFKKWYTVFSPTVQLGNNSSNFVFAFLSGIDPVTMAGKYPQAFRELKNKGDVYNLLVKNGILGSDVITGDLRPLTAKTEAITKEIDKIKKGILDRASKIDKKITDIYSGSDDLAKVSAFMSLKEYGYSDAKAIELVYNGFQNYSSVGKIWDLASKTPLIGNPFIKFQADLQRILVNAAFRRPLSTAMFIGILKGLATIASNWSDEDEKEKEIREGRKFIPKIKLPNAIGGDVPLVFQTPAGEVNLARFLSPYYSYDVGDLQSPAEEFTKYLPYQVKLIEGREAGSQDIFFPKQDPLIGTWWAAIIDDMDFREQSIQDPTATKYRTSGATPIEKSLNAMNYIARSQVPLYSNAMDMYTSWNYGVDFYNRSKSPGQVFMSTFVKVQDFKDEDYKKTVLNEKKNIYYKVQGLNKQMGDIKKDASEQITDIKENLKDGKITQRQFDVRYEDIIKTKDKRQSIVIDKIAQEQQKMNELTTKYANILE